MAYFDRYKEFKNNGEIKIIPGIFLTEKSTDKRDVYKIGVTRLDKLSQKYYNNPFHGFLILAANPQFGGLEFNIPNNTILRIPFPFLESVRQYEELIEEHIRLYGK